MAESPAHRFGQIIGEVLETALEPILSKFARKHKLYLDKRGSRPCRQGQKCTWTDHNGNKHDLDFVLERNGSRSKQGMPVAFIETAWRRYTKHSRNKAQEIQGAIEPLAETYKGVRPFKGAVLAGVFTEGALKQLRSLGFSVLYVPYEKIVSVFSKFGIDASFDESTSDSRFAANVKAYDALPTKNRLGLAGTLFAESREQVVEFVKSLERTVQRQIDRITVLPLHGRSFDLATLSEAIDFIGNYREDGGDPTSLVRYEIRVKYSNGDVIEGTFIDKEGALGFLRGFQLPAV